MLRLININKNDKTIEADFLPEGSKKKYHIVLDIMTETYKADSSDEFDAMYARMAANGLIRELNDPSPNRERTVMWY